MKRGSKFFSDYSEASKPATGNKSKGRAADMIRQRNEKLFYRYYYYSKLLKYSYDVTLLQLTNEFDLTESSLTQYIERNTDMLKKIADEKLSRRQLKCKFPHFDWSAKEAVIRHTQYSRK